MAGSPSLNVCNGFVNGVDDADRENRPEEFSRPILLRGRSNPGDKQLRAGAAAQFHAMLLKLSPERGQQILCDAVVHQQGFHRAADAVTVCFRVEGDACRHVQVGIRVDIHVAVAVKVFDHRHARLGGEAVDQTLASTRDDDVDVLGHGDEVADRRTVGRIDHLDCCGRQPGGLQALTHDAAKRHV